MSDVDAQVSRAAQLRADGRHEQAAALLGRLTRENPSHAVAHYQMAWLLDAQGQESDAVPYYERALELGLDGDDKRGAMLGLGSTYRVLGRYTESERLLKRGADAFPGDTSFSVFRAMALYNLARHEEAMQVLLHVVAATSTDPQVLRYARAIRQYAGELDRVDE